MSGRDYVRRRATVKIRQRDPEAEDGYWHEWVHSTNLDRDELGVTLHWPEDETEVFVPWASVVRIDVQPCTCAWCRRVASELGMAA